MSCKTSALPSRPLNRSWRHAASNLLHSGPNTRQPRRHLNKPGPTLRSSSGLRAGRFLSKSSDDNGQTRLLPPGLRAVPTRHCSLFLEPLALTSSACLYQEERLDESPRLEASPIVPARVSFSVEECRASPRSGRVRCQLADL
jgi:hypothetical protein